MWRTDLLGERAGAPGHESRHRPMRSPARSHPEPTAPGARPGPATVLGLARNLTAEEMVASLPAVRLALEEHGDPDLERFMAERVGTMLHLRGYPADMR